MAEVKVKSNAPWILGIIGIFLTIAHYACAILCSAGLAALGEAAEDSEGAQAAFNGSMALGSIAALIMVVCFILTFFGKSNASKVTGILLILGGITAAVMSCPHFSIAGLAAGVIYMCAGISSCCNAKKIKA